MNRQANRQLLIRLTLLGVVQAYVVGWVVDLNLEPPLPPHLAHFANHTGPRHDAEPALQFLRDATLAVPVAVAVLLGAALLTRTLLLRRGLDLDGVAARVGFAVLAAVGAALASVPAVQMHGVLFGAQVLPGDDLTAIALITLRYTFALVLGSVLLFGVPWRAGRRPFRAAPEAAVT